MLLTFSSEKKTCSCYMYRSLSFFSMLGLKDLNVPLFLSFFSLNIKTLLLNINECTAGEYFVFLFWGDEQKKIYFPQLFFVFFKLIHGVTALLHHWQPSCSFAQYTVFKNGGGGEAAMEDTQAKVTISLHQRCETQLEYRNHRGRRTFGTTCPYYIHKLFQLFKVFRVFAPHHLWEF